MSYTLYEVQSLFGIKERAQALKLKVLYYVLASARAERFNS